MARRMVLSWLVVGLVVCAAGAGFAADDEKAPDKRADERLDQPISVAVAYDSLQEFCARLRRMSDVSITVDRTIRDHKLVIRVREQPLREVMRQIARLFDFT